MSSAHHDDAPHSVDVLRKLAIVVVLFGARRLPEIGSGLGRAIKNFKSGVSGKDEIDVTPKKEVAEGEAEASRSD